MMNNPARDIKREISTLAFGHEVPLKSTPFVGSSVAAGYDGPGECLQHVYEMMPGELKTGNATRDNWIMFDQAEFAGEKAIGFQAMGWVYVPSRCHPVVQNVRGERHVSLLFLAVRERITLPFLALLLLPLCQRLMPFLVVLQVVKNSEGGTGSAACKLVVRPGKCVPPNMDVAPDVAEFANYAQANGMVVLSPCLGGPVDKSFEFAKDIKAGRLDVSASLSTRQIWTAIQRESPNHLGLWLIRSTASSTRTTSSSPRPHLRPPQRLSSNKMALITSGCVPPAGPRPTCAPSARWSAACSACPSQPSRTARTRPRRPRRRHRRSTAPRLRSPARTR